MKFAISPFEQFALTSHLVGLPSPTPEYARKRLKTWDVFKVSELADQLVSGAAFGKSGIDPSLWSPRDVSVVVDVENDVLAHVIAGLGSQTSGLWSDVLFRLRERLESLRDKTYELPGK